MTYGYYLLSWAAFCASVAWRYHVVSNIIDDGIVRLYSHIDALEVGTILAMRDEIMDVPRWRPTVRAFFGSDWLKCYGPVCQIIHDFGGLTDPVHTKVWWAVYTRLYVGLPPKEKRKINRARMHFVSAMMMCGYTDPVIAIECDVYKEETSKSNSCGIGAAEYEEIMAAQEIVNGL